MKNFLLIVFTAVSFNCLGQTDLIVHDLLYAKGVESIFEVYHMDQDGNTTSLQDQNRRRKWSMEAERKNAYTKTN